MTDGVYWQDLEKMLEQSSQKVEIGGKEKRKKTMYENSDAFLCLPGGIGTLEEVSETITWFQLKISRKPIFFLNINGYWNNFRVLLEQFVSLEFSDQDLLNYLNFFESVETLIPSLLSSLDIPSKE